MTLHNEDAALYPVLSMSNPTGRAAEWQEPLWDAIHDYARGGSHTIGNLLPACKPCNSSKRNRLLIEWRRTNGIRLA